MRLHTLPLSLISLVLGVVGPAAAQFEYPPPLVRPLTDYTSGAAVSALNFSAGDNLIGKWTVPVGLAPFLLYRCTHTPSSTPIYPLNSTFNSTQGDVANDGTWEQMPLFTNSDFGNGFNSGTSLWFSPEFYEGNFTTGDLCWFELYPGRNSQTYDNTAGGYQNTATVNGAGAWYFASEPFVVKPARPSGQVVTWRDDGTERGKPTQYVSGNSTGNETSSTTGSSGPTPTNAGKRLYVNLANALLLGGAFWLSI